MGGYLFDQAWAHERRRLDALASVYDRGTFERLSRLGVVAGARCLEVGAGSGTVARWMADQVGAGGSVVATDIDPRFLDELADPRIETRRHDIAADPLEEAAFDVIHARALLQHVPGRDAALRTMVRALRPGGRILIEDIISPAPVSHPPLPPWGRVLAGMERGLRQRGADPHYGIQLPVALEAAGLVGVECAGGVELLRSGTPDIEFVVLSVEQVGPHLVAAGAVTAPEVDELLAALRGPGYILAAAIMVAAWGMAPATSS